MASSGSKGNLAPIAQKIFKDALNNIIHNILIQRHREHKLLLLALDPETRLPHCEQCNLPRLLSPPLAPKVRGASSDQPKDTVYCDRRPWCRTKGFDIYGNPFPKGDVTGRPPSKKEREAAKNSKKDEGTPASNEGADVNGTAPPSPSAEDGQGGAANGRAEKLEKGEKKASKIDEKLKKGEYVPWQTCPSCKRSLLVTRFAKHLEQCMGLSGRQASRNAMAKMNGSTPGGSRGGSPGPSQEGKEDDEDEDEKIKGPGNVRKKVLKKSAKDKMKREKSTGAGTASINGKLAKPSKRPPGSQQRESPDPSPRGTEGKRDRDEMMLGDDGDDDDNVHVKKRQKVQRVGSTVSVASQSTVAPLSAIEMERADSNDGSFVDDVGSNADD